MTKTHVIAGLLALLTIGCGGRTRYPDYYTLAIVPPPDPAVSEARRLGSLAVQRFETAAYLRQGRIVYREAPNQVGFYEYHRWASDPSETIATAVAKAARSSGLFSRVEPYHDDEKPEYILRGRLERLDEIDYGGGVRVEAEIFAQLVNLRTGSTVWSGDVAESSNVDSRTVNSVVGAMSHAVQTGIDRLMRNMERQFAEAAKEK